METKDSLDWFFDAWEWVKRFVKHTIESNFTCLEDFVFFVALFGSMFVVIIILTLAAYNIGYDKGETAGLQKGFASGTTITDSGIK